MVNKVKKRSKKTRRLLLPAIGATIIIIAAGGFAAWHYHEVSRTKASQNSTNSINYKPAPAADNNANQSRKVSSTPSPTLNNTGLGKGSSSTTSSSPSTTAASYTVQIVNDNVNNGNLHVGTLVSGTTTGTCVLTASQTGQSTLQLSTSSVSQDVNDYDCGAFNIPTSKFPTTGTWELTLTVSNNGAAASGSANVTI
jgi:hypothetical protein